MQASLVVALQAEARPLLSHFGLRGTGGSGPFRLYTADGLELVVSGVGKVAAAAATAYLAASAGGRQRAWLNLGICGASGHSRGTALLAHKVEDAATGRSWYPPLVFDPPCATVTVRTVDRPQTTLEGETAFEMEASGFYETAARFATAELVHVLKVVSDNGPADLAKLSAGRISEWIEGAVPVVEALVSAVDSIASELASRRAAPATLQAFQDRWRFTVTERRRLERLLRRLEVVDPAGRREPRTFEGASRREVLDGLEERLAAVRPGVL